MRYENGVVEGRSGVPARPFKEPQKASHGSSFDFAAVIMPDMTHARPYANSSRDMEHPQRTTGRVGFCLETQRSCLRNTAISHACMPKTMSVVPPVHMVTGLYLEPFGVACAVGKSSNMTE